MKQFFRKVADVYNKVVHSSIFLKVLSVLIGIGLWFVVINIVNPLKTSEYSRVPVKIDMTGSVAEYYGLSIVDGIPSVTVDVEVEGSRSGLINFSKEKLSATLDLTPVTEAGGYTLDITVKSADKDVVITSVEPSTIFCEFDTTSTKTFTVALNSTGNLPAGYVVKSQGVNPSTIEITGPTSVVSSIESISVLANLDDRTTSFSYTDSISVKNAEGVNVSRSSLTFSAETVTYNYNLAYQKTVPVGVNLINTCGGNESAYMSVQYSYPEICLEGSKEYLDNITVLNIGNIATDVISEYIQTYTLPVPTNINYTLPYDAQSVIQVTVTYDPSLIMTKTFTFTQKEIERFILLNCPVDMEATITEEELTVTVRGLVSQIESLSKDDLVCVIDCNVTDSLGRCKVNVSLPEYINYGLLGRVFAAVDFTVVEEAQGN